MRGADNCAASRSPPPSDFRPRRNIQPSQKPACPASMSRPGTDSSSPPRPRPKSCESCKPTRWRCSRSPPSRRSSSSSASASLDRHRTSLPRRCGMKPRDGGRSSRPPASRKRSDMITRRRFTALATVSALAPEVIARPALAQTQAQTWPNRIVKLVVPFTPGGGIDGIARIVGARLSETWGQQVVVENKPGAGGNIASEMVARSAPDGYTMYITAAGLAVNRYLFPSINYDPVADFAPVTLICLFPNLLVVPASSPLHTVKDLIAAAKANPGKLTFASPGHGTSPHMSAELFKYMAKVDLTHVLYRGASP